MIYFLILALFSGCVFAQGSSKVHKDIVYAQIGKRQLHLDLYLPDNDDSPCLLVWIHGGAWRSGTKDDVPLNFVKQGFAMASIEYRLSEEAQFPAMIYDIKAAIRFLRGNAKKYGYQSGKIAIAGSSAGGHLVALVGTTNNDRNLEGTLGDYTDQSSSVQAVIDYFGPTDFMTILKQSTPHGLNVREPALKLLLGDLPDKKADLARMASPVFHIDNTDPPLFILHGNQDPQVPINQSYELYSKYKERNLDVELEIINDAVHGGPAFFDQQRVAKVTAFLDRVLKRRFFSYDSRPHKGVPKGKITKYVWKSNIFANTTRDYYVYVPAQYNPEKPAALMIFQDGHAYVDENGDQRAPVVCDNLIYQKKMPVTIGLFINPGYKSKKRPESPWRNDNRSIEYDTLSDDYVRFLTEEIIPEIRKRYYISDDPAMHAIGGLSSGAICAFTAAWQRPDYFSKVLSQIGSFTNIKGGHNYPSMIRQHEKKNIKIFIQDGSNDLDNRFGNWWLSNQQMAAAFRYKGYDYKFVRGTGGHSGKDGGHILPESLIWLWSDVMSGTK